MEPSELQIPPSAVGPLEVVRDLSDQEFATLVSVLDEGGAAGIDEVSRALGDRLPELPTDPASLVGSLVSLDLFRESRGWSPSQMADQIARSTAWASATEEQTTFLRLRVEMLLEAESVVVMAGALKGALASERVFEGIDVITDVRPVFGFGEYSRVPVVILHNLRLEYRTQGRSESLYVTLDALDLDELERAIATARRTAAELTDALEETRLQPTAPPWRRG